MKKTIFISYSRRNQYFAERLKLDLERAGLRVWWDQCQRSISLGDDWRSKIRDGIESCDQVLHLWSPEAEKSDYVKEELAYAAEKGKNVIPILVAGREAGMSPPTLALQNCKFEANYWEGLADLLGRLGITDRDLQTPDMLLNLQIDAREAAKILGNGGASGVYPHYFHSQRIDFAVLPLLVSGYASASFVLDSSRPINPDNNDLFVVVEVSGWTKQNGSKILNEVLSYKRAVDSKASVLFVKGPVATDEMNGRDRTGYELPNECLHIWGDIVDLIVTSVLKYPDRRIHFFMNAPLPIAFGVGNQLRGFYHVLFYNFVQYRKEPEKRYQMVYESSRRS